MRETVSKELRQQQAENRFYEISQTLINLGYEHPDSLEPAAQIAERAPSGQRLVQSPERRGHHGSPQGGGKRL